jgi:hypothetical protein
MAAQVIVAQRRGYEPDLELTGNCKFGASPFFLAPKSSKPVDR